MVMINVGDDASVALQLFENAYEGMRYVVHSITDEEEVIYKSVLKQLKERTDD